MSRPSVETPEQEALRAVCRAAATRAIKAAGGGLRTAAALGVSKSAVSQWKKYRGVPAEYVRRLSAMSGVPDFELRPDVFYEVLREDPDAQT